MDRRGFLAAYCVQQTGEVAEDSRINIPCFMAGPLDERMNRRNLLQTIKRFLYGDYLLGWRPMRTAPRDGTIVETKCTAGVMPWYGLHCWKTTPDVSWGKTPVWLSVPYTGVHVTSEEHMTWRPYSGDVEKYVDPTRGRQETKEYWQKA
jgi:hypothetical protein